MSNDTQTSGETIDKDLTDSELEKLSGGAYLFYVSIEPKIKTAQDTPTPPPPPPTTN
jgi:hypothetical protein